MYDDRWNEIVPEGCYPDDQIRVLLRERAPLELLIDSKRAFEVPGTEIAQQKVIARISCLGRFVHQLGPDFSRPGGMGSARGIILQAFEQRSPKRLT